jgi:hypothetical protein
MKIFRSATALFLLMSLASGAVFAQAEPTDSFGDQWDRLLQKHVRPGKIGDVELMVVDYQGLRDDPAWPKALEALAQTPEPADPAAKKAFWINAYNILAIKIVLDHYPVESIKDISGWFSSVWKAEAGQAAGAARTLDEMEHQILRSMGDPRIHAAIVCASVSCPDVRREAYRAERLEQQLDDQVRSFLANSNKGARLTDTNHILYVSKIFDWFSEDFEQENGQSLKIFLQRYLPADMAQSVSDSTALDYFDYDWSLNDAKRSSV